MTTTWVVHESESGTTREIAEAVAEELAGRAEVALHEISRAPTAPLGVGLVVLGRATQAIGGPAGHDETGPSAQRPDRVAPTDAREWLDLVGPRVPPITFATFDTRVRHPRVSGSAAKEAAAALRRLGHTEIAAPASFWVQGADGPLLDGELDRARAWARDLADVVPGPGADDAASHSTI